VLHLLLASSSRYPFHLHAEAFHIPLIPLHINSIILVYPLRLWLPASFISRVFLLTYYLCSRNTVYIRFGTFILFSKRMNSDGSNEILNALAGFYWEDRSLSSRKPAKHQDHELKHLL